MKKTRFGEMLENVASNYPGEQGQRIAAFMEEEYNKLCSDFSDKHDPMERHKRNNIFPVVAAFRALIAEGFDRDEAAKVANDNFLVLMKKPATAIQKMMKIPGAYRLMPWLWKIMMPKLFSEDSGFVFSFYPTDKKEVKFDMKKCPYLEACKELDAIELAPTFCTTDDVCYGNMHPKLIWNRTKTLAKNGEDCDFDLYIK